MENIASTSSEQPKMNFETVLQHVFYRTKESAIIARSVICKSGDIRFPVLQLGRFKNGWDASKYLIALNDEEAKWLIEFIPTMVKRAFKTKPDTGDVFELKEFENNRSISVALISFKKKKQLQFTQTTVRDDDEVQRVVSFPVLTVSDMRQKLIHLRKVHDIIFNAEHRLEKTDGVFTAFLAYAVEGAMARAASDGTMTSVLDEDLLARMVNRRDIVANFWIAAKFISLNFHEFREVLDYIFAKLEIVHFNEERLAPQNLLEMFCENPDVFKSENLEMFALVNFLVDNKNTV